jgi:pyruvate,water dikinase
MGVFYRRARQFRLYREQISSTYTFGYGLFRGNYLALGEALVRQGRLEQAEDVFYLYEPELGAILAGESAGDADLDYVALVKQRKLEIEQVRAVDLPEVIYGDQPPPVVLEVERVLKGTPTARGYYTGRVKNVRGIQDFPRVQSGDIVVVPYSDVGWTPLFARAGAVIAEAGGILSHCSIVAREYGIPAVVSVSGVAHLEDDSLVTVDGYKGQVILHDEQDEGEPSVGES